MVIETTPKNILDKLNAGIDITSTDLDIRDLTSASDSVEAKQSTASNLKTEIYNPTGTALATANYVYDGSTWQSMTGNSSGAQKTFFEWLADNGTYTSGDGSTDNTTSTLYTVPAGKVFYLIHAEVSFYGTILGGGYTGQLTAGGNKLLFVNTEFDSSGGSNAVAAPSIPIRLDAADTITIETNSSDAMCYGMYAGYEIST